MNKLYLLSSKLGWLVLLVALAGCALSSTPEMPTAPPATQTPGVTQIPPPATYTPPPTIITLSPTLSPTMAAETLALEPSIPVCTFASDAAPEVAGPSLDDYIFSDLQVVLTHTSAIGIAGWLPDSQRLLITRLIPGQSREYIETFDVQTGELQLYGERRSSRNKPVWLAAERAVAFADALPGKPVVLRVSQGQDVPVEDMVTGLAVPYLAASPDGQQLVFFSKSAREHPQIFNVGQTQSQALSFTLPLTPEQDLHALGQMSGPDPYQADWHPNGKQVAFYNDIYFYLADLVSERICRVDLTRSEGVVVETRPLWAIHTQWSPDGRYLAMLTTVGDPAVKFSNLTILDTATGELRSMHPKDITNSEQNYVTDITWAPNSQVLATWFVVQENAGTHEKGLYLVDAVTGQSKRVLPQIVFTGGDWGRNITWSPDGQHLAANCPTKKEGRLCLITITTQR